jgi:Mg2+/citrate symporter
MIDWINQTEGIWTYIVLFLLSAAPWLEVFLVIPLGVGMGLDPIAVAVTGFIGNWIPILLIGVFFKQLSMWLASRKERKRLKRALVEGDTYSEIDDASEQEQQDKKHRRARGIWVKYGLPGLALLAPAIIGTDIAAILALAFGSPRRLVMIWMTISLLLWSIVLAVGSVYGFSFVGMHS